MMFSTDMIGNVFRGEGNNHLKEYQPKKFLTVRRWHYSKKIPVGKLVNVGVWENQRFIGAIVFADGLLGSSSTYFGMNKYHIAEIVRIALREHVTPVSKMISVAIKLSASVALVSSLSLRSPIRAKTIMAAFIKPRISSTQV